MGIDHQSPCGLLVVTGFASGSARLFRHCEKLRSSDVAIHAGYKAAKFALHLAQSGKKADQAKPMKVHQSQT